MLNKIMGVVKEAGELIEEFEKKLGSLKLTNKQGEGIASEADIEVENFLVSELTKIQKGKILAEESFFRLEDKNFENFKTGSAWVIDPIDGTNNFLNNIPFYSVCVAFMDEAQVQYGVVYNPKNKECFVAEKNKGMQFHNLEQNVLKGFRKESSKKLEQSVVSLGFVCPRSSRGRVDYERFQRMLDKTRAVRKFGSAALDLCYVAIDRIDVFYEYNLKPWDIAAASLICQEANVKVTDLDGHRFDLFSRDILAAKEPLLTETIEFMNNFDR